MKEHTFVQMTYDQWEEEFNPIKNPLIKDGPYDGCMFETYGEEYEALKKHDIQYVWTLRTSDNGDEMIITSGHGWVNRMGYFVTTKPWDENTEYEIEACC